jgi:hypothetical protein
LEPYKNSELGTRTKDVKVCAEVVLDRGLRFLVRDLESLATELASERVLKWDRLCVDSRRWEGTLYIYFTSFGMFGEAFLPLSISGSSKGLACEPQSRGWKAGGG